MILDTHMALRVASKAVLTVSTGDIKDSMHLSITAAGQAPLAILLTAEEGRVLGLMIDRTQRDCR